MTDRDIMKLALEALENLQGLCTDAEDGLVEAVTIWTPEIIDALRERLAQPEQPSVPWSAALEAVWGEPEQEPVAWRYDLKRGGSFAGVSTEYSPVKLSIGENWTPLYTSPPQRKPLPPQSPCEMTQAERKMFRLGWLECEAAHGIKGET